MTNLHEPAAELGSLEVGVKVPWLSRMICKYFWHSYKGVINEHGVLQWLVCTRCGERLDVVWGGQVTRKPQI